MVTPHLEFRYVASVGLQLAGRVQVGVGSGGKIAPGTGCIFCLRLMCLRNVSSLGIIRLRGEIRLRFMRLRNVSSRGNSSSGGNSSSFNVSSQCVFAG